MDVSDRIKRQLYMLYNEDFKYLSHVRIGTITLTSG